MKVLIVDDSKLIHSFICSTFEKRNIKTVSVFNGQEALDQLNQNSNFDLVLLDWNMPVMDGPTFLESILHSKKVTCPIVMMTTENSPKKIIQAMGLGASEYVMKPFTEEVLLQKIEMVLQNKVA